MRETPHGRVPADPRRNPREARRKRARRRLRARRALITAVFGSVALAAAGYLIFVSPPETDEPGGAAATTSGTDHPVSAGRSPTPAPTTPPPVLNLPGDFPGEGPGTFRYAGGEGDVLGESGTLVRFRVAVEDGIDSDLAEFADFAEQTLGGAQGWTAGGDTTLQRVPQEVPHDFTLHLATGQTTAQMCADGGLDIMGDGLPDGGVSCHYDGNVMINLNRWRLSVPHFVGDEVPLEVYRQMLINHEVGHALGLGHESCPGEGEPAPVMQQQTITLDGCEPYAWPYLDGQRYQGPPS